MFIYSIKRYQRLDERNNMGNPEYLYTRFFVRKDNLEFPSYQYLSINIISLI